VWEQGREGKGSDINDGGHATTDYMKGSKKKKMMGDGGWVMA